MDATVGTEQFKQLYANNEDRSIVDVLDLAVNLKITAVDGSPLLQHRGHAAENSCSTRSSPELSINSPVNLQAALVTRPSMEAPFRVTSNTDALGETIVDVQNLAANLKIAAAVGSPLLQYRGHAAENSCSTRSSPELRMNSPVYLQDEQLVIGPLSEAPFRVASNTTSLIDALDLAVDRGGDCPAATTDTAERTFPVVSRTANAVTCSVRQREDSCTAGTCGIPGSKVCRSAEVCLEEDQTVRLEVVGKHGAQCLLLSNLRRRRVIICSPSF